MRDFKIYKESDGSYKGETLDSIIQVIGESAEDVFTRLQILMSHEEEGDDV